MKKTVTVAKVLNERREEIFKLVEKGQLNSCLDLIKDILNNCQEVDRVSANKCIMTLSKSIYNPNKFGSTLMTWLTAIKVIR